jgi:hypothetical protein
MDFQKIRKIFILKMHKHYFYKLNIYYERCECLMYGLEYLVASVKDFRHVE